MDYQPSVLIFSHSAQLRSSLQVLAASSARVKSIRMAGDLKTVNNTDPGYTPDLVILAFESADTHIRATLEQIKTAWPETPIIVLVDSERDVPEGVTSYVEAVLVKGILAANLLRVIEDLLEGGA